MPPSTPGPSSKSLSGRHLSFAERQELAIQHGQGAGVPQLARHMGRSGSTISRELRRNAATRGGELDYRATTAQWHAERAARRPKPAQVAGKLLAELQGPAPDRLVRDNNPALDHEILDVTQAEGETEVESNGVADHLGWKPMVLVGDRSHVVQLPRR